MHLSTPQVHQKHTLPSSPLLLLSLSSEPDTNPQQQIITETQLAVQATTAASAAANSSDSGKKKDMINQQQQQRLDKATSVSQNKIARIYKRRLTLWVDFMLDLSFIINSLQNNIEKGKSLGMMEKA
eukprot:9997783-Ditylum_brightwellii.AAC.1